jgi:ArsR family transcriptional regulator
LTNVLNFDILFDAEMITKEVVPVDEKEIAVMLKAMGDENRIRILWILYEGEACARDILEKLNISQPTLSHHMKILCDAGIVIGSKKGKWVHYSLCRDGIDTLRMGFEKLLTACEQYNSEQ